MPVIHVTSKGQATLPKELRDKLGIKAPGRVVIEEEEGRLVVRPLLLPSEMAPHWAKVFAGGPSRSALRAEERKAERRREARLARLAQRAEWRSQSRQGKGRRA